MVDVAGRLAAETRELAALFERRLLLLKGVGEASSVTLGRSEADLSLLGGGGWAFGVDGSMDYDEHLEMLLFYVVGAAYRCPVSVEGGLRLDLKRVERDDSLGLSTAVPLWSEDLGDMGAGGVAGFGEQAEVVRAQRLPFALMTMAELAVALRSVERDSARIVFLDRPLSGTLQPLLRDVRLLVRSGETALVGWDTPHGRLSLLDIVLASALGPPGTYVPPRRPYTVYAAISAIMEAAGEGVVATPQWLARRLGLDDKTLERTLRGLHRLDKRFGGALFSEFSPAAIAVAPGVEKYWGRVMGVVEDVVSRVFGGRGGHPLYLGGDRWLGALELNALNAFLLLELASRSLRRGVLLLGLIKDTSATDYIRAALPHLYSRGAVGLHPGRVGFKSDTAFLTILSAANAGAISTPWRTHAYDSCFSSLVCGVDGSARAARRRVSRERLFVKAYFQLRSFRLDPSMRSPVFAYERPFDPKHDSGFVGELHVEDEDGEVLVRPFLEVGGRSGLDGLALEAVAAADNPEVLEAYGHNQLLYLADKYVKAQIKLMRQTLRGIADHELSSLERRERIFMVARRFREFRAQVEVVRERSSEKRVGEEG